MTIKGASKILLVASIFGISALFTMPASTISYQDDVELQFTWNSYLSMSVSDSSIAATVSSGGSVASDPITITHASNNGTGLKLFATVGSTTYNSTDLVKSGDSTKKFTCVSTSASLSSLTSDNTWGYSWVSNTSGGTYSNISGLPKYDGTEKEIRNVGRPTGAGSAYSRTRFRIHARAGATQPAGTYENVINFSVVANT